MARLPIAFELMRRLFTKVMLKPDAIGLRFVQDIVPVTIGTSDTEYVWVKIPLDAILSFALPEDTSVAED